MTLSDLSIHRPVFAWMLMAALLVFGSLAFTRMGVSQLPNVDFPVITVNLSLEGAAPEVMEMDVTDVVENAVMGIQGVRKVTSVSLNSAATVSIEFDLSRNIDAAQQDVQAKLQQAQRLLPEKLDPPIITKTNAADFPIVWMTVASDTIPLKDLNAYVRDSLKNRFTTVPGVGDVFLGGFVEPNLRVWVSNAALRRYQLTAADVIDTIAAQNVEPPAGFIESGPREYNVRTKGEVTTAEALARLQIITRGQAPNFRPILLGQVARTEEGLADIRRIARSDGRPAVGLGVLKQRGANEVAVALAVKKRLEQVRRTLPPGMRLDLNYDSTSFIEQSVHDLIFTLALAAILTGLVCWLFLGAISPTVNVWLAIPTSIIGTFLVISFAGFTLNTFTVLALTLVVGVVVDDAIMMQENISRHLELGEHRIQAAKTGAREITFAATASSLAIVAIFLPIAFVSGIVGRFLFEFGVTLSVAVMLSLLEAVTLTPMRASQFVTIRGRKTPFGRGVEAAIDWSRRGYRRLLDWALRRRWTVIAFALLFFMLSIFSTGAIKKEFTPAQDQGIFLVQLTTPVGSSIGFTDERSRRMEAFLARQPAVEKYFVIIGGFSGGEVTSAIAFVTLKPLGRRGRNPATGREWTQRDLMDLCRAEFNRIPSVEAVIQDLSLSGFATTRGYPVEFTIQGPDWNALGRYSERMVQALKKTGLMTDIDTDYEIGMPEIQVIPNRERAAARGVSAAVIGQAINAMIGGEVAGTYPKGGHRYDIRVKLDEDWNTADRKALIQSLFVRNNSGELIPLSEVTDVVQRRTLQSISRVNRERAITVTANVAPKASQQEALDEVRKIGRALLPPGYRVELTGSAETFRESFSGLLLALFLGIVVSYMILGSQFNSFIDPATVLMALPFSVSGAFLGLLATRQTLNLYSMIGLILLMGIVKKNSILLVDFTNRRREQGLDVRAALLDACPIRLRPILMTSISVIAGALPAALAIGPGSSTRIPMAVAVIGGVLVSTLLTLLVVPCVYSLVARLERPAAHRQAEAESPEGD